MSSSAGVLLSARRFYIDGMTVSILFHIVLAVILSGWLTRSSQNNPGMLPPAIELQSGVYQLENVLPEIAEGPRQELAMPETTQVDEKPLKNPQEKLPVTEYGKREPRVKKEHKPHEKKAPVAVTAPEEPIPDSDKRSAATSSPRSSDAPKSMADFSSAAANAVSGTPGWQSLVHTHLAKFKRYPRAALRYRATGICTVSVTLSAQGDVLSASIMTSSGNTILDREALATIIRATPFPPPPGENQQGGVVQMVTPISFYL